MTDLSAFPHYSASDLPALPQGWTDSTWRNDACPSYAILDHEEVRVRVWIDYVQPANREAPHGSRFTVVHEDWNRIAEGMEVNATLYHGDSWEEATAAAESKVVAMLAAMFSRLIREDLTTDELREVRRVNAERNDPMSCATQDVRDANMIMLEAYEAVMGDELDTESELQAAIWNRAWDLAKAAGFTSDVGTLETLSKELEAYCATHGIPYACALELSMSGEFPSHAAWLEAFCARWAIAEEARA